MMAFGSIHIPVDYVFLLGTNFIGHFHYGNVMTKHMSRPSTCNLGKIMLKE